MLADLVFEDADGLVEGVDDEVDAAGAEGGFDGGGVGVEREGGASGDADRGGQAGGGAGVSAGEDELASVAGAACDEFAIEAKGLALEVGGREHGWGRSQVFRYHPTDALRTRLQMLILEIVVYVVFGIVPDLGEGRDG